MDELMALEDEKIFIRDIYASILSKLICQIFVGAWFGRYLGCLECSKFGSEIIDAIHRKISSLGIQ
jgi:hypothetical protein